MEATIKIKSREEIAEAYKSEPWWYDVRGFFILIFAYNSTLGKQLKFFGPNFGDRHLELACGTGTLLQFILRWRKRKKLAKTNIIGVDYAPSMLAGARHRFSKQESLEFKHADAADLPFQNNSFDTINVANAIHCFPNVDAALNEIIRVLKPNGTLAANVLLYPLGSGILKIIAQKINKWGIRKGILVTPYSVEDLQSKFLKAGFEIVSEEISGNCYNILAKRV